MTLTDFLLVFAGLVAGTIDSIAGGGGLITLPVLTAVLDAGPQAIGTNKIVGTAGAAIAFFVYLRRHPLSLQKGIVFLVGIGIGSFCGSLCSPLLPKIYFRMLLLFLCPVVLWILWNKKFFIHEAQHHGKRPFAILAAVGGVVGFYDGFFGPGGGTFMLLGLLWAVRLSLVEALLLSKLANTISAGVSLISYSMQGFVHVQEGSIMAMGMLLGSFMGANLASRRTEKIVRPVLLVVVLLLLVTQMRELIAK